MRIDVKEFAALFDDAPTERSSSWKRRSGFVGKLHEDFKSVEILCSSFVMVNRIIKSYDNWHLGNIHLFWTNPAADVGVQCEQRMHQKNSRERPLSKIGRSTPLQNSHMAIWCFFGSTFSASQAVWSCGPVSFVQWPYEFGPAMFRLPNRMNNESSLVLHRLSTKF